MSIDRFLRRWGFVIHDRPHDGQAVWRDKKSGRLFLECDAWTLALGREKEAVEEDRKRGIR
jgi:hypothetical protein